jgi:ABC-2 type transport system ATP-binding protein
MEIMASVNNLTKVFGEREVIRNCTIAVEKGTIYGFLGANGAGKTTFLKLLTGLLNPTAGQIEIAGMNIADHREAALRNIGSLIEVPVFYDHLTAQENLEIHLSYMGVQGAGIADILKQVGLDVSETKPVSGFSLGMRQRLGIARAIIHRPKLLLLDEPINGLDPMGIRDMRELFLDLAKKQGTTMIISSHILSEIEHIADSAGVIAEGAIVQEVAMSEVKANFPSGLEGYFMEIMSGGKTHA